MMLISSAMDVLVDNVMLAGGETVTFMYTSAMAQGTTGAANVWLSLLMAVTVPNTGPVAVGGTTAVDGRRGRSPVPVQQWL